MKLSDIRIDPAVIEAGDWVGELPFPGMDGVRLRVRGTGNVDYRRLQSKLLKAASLKRLDPQQEEEAATAVMTELLAKTILIGWDGIVQDDDAPLAFTPDLAAQLLADPEMRVFRDAVIYAGNQIASRRKTQKAAYEKN